jgi:hypothetical protein
VRVQLDPAAARGALWMHLVHPTRTGLDQSLNLAAAEPGLYMGSLRPLPPGRWHVVLEGEDWRLAGDWILPAAGALILGRAAPEAGDKSREGKR